LWCLAGGRGRRGCRAHACHRSRHGRQNYYRKLHRRRNRRAGQLSRRLAGRNRTGPYPWPGRTLPAGNQSDPAIHWNGHRPAAQATWVDGEGCVAMKNTLTLAVLAVLLVLLIALPWIAPYFYIFIATEILILGLFAASFNLIFGYTGMLSFGHAAFFGIGAYATALLLQGMQWPLLACLLVAIAAGAVLALVIGFFSVRLNEVYFSMLTLAF